MLSFSEGQLRDDVDGLQSSFLIDSGVLLSIMSPPGQLLDDDGLIFIFNPLQGRRFSFF